MISVHQNRIQISRRRFVRVNLVIVLSKILLKIFYSPGFRETIFYIRRANNFLLFRYFIKNRLTNDSRECRFSFAFFLLSDQRERLVYVQLVFFFFFFNVPVETLETERCYVTWAAWSEERRVLHPQKFGETSRLWRNVHSSTLEIILQIVLARK